MILFHPSIKSFKYFYFPIFFKSWCIMVEFTGEMLKKFMITFTMFIVFVFLLNALYDIVADSIVGALTGNWQYDMLIYLVALAFGAGVVMILYEDYINDDGDD